MKVSPLCDADKDDDPGHFSKSQLGFIDFIVRPLWGGFASFVLALVDEHEEEVHAVSTDVRGDAASTLDQIECPANCSYCNPKGFRAVDIWHKNIRANYTHWKEAAAKPRNEMFSVNHDGN